MREMCEREREFQCRTEQLVDFLSQQLRNFETPTQMALSFLSYANDALWLKNNNNNYFSIDDFTWWKMRSSIGHRDENGEASGLAIGLFYLKFLIKTVFFSNLKFWAEQAKNSSLNPSIPVSNWIQQKILVKAVQFIVSDHNVLLMMTNWSFCCFHFSF